MDLFRSGSNEAFEELVGRYRPALMQRFARFAGTPVAEDIVQQTFERAIVRLRNPSPIEIRPWLYRIAHNLWVDHLRRHERANGSLTGAERAERDTSTEAALERHEELRQLVTDIAALPWRHRQALTMRELEGRDYSEIAIALDTTEINARKLTQLARTRLRDRRTKG